MTEVETMTKESTFELTAALQKHVTRIQNSLIQHGVTLMEQIIEPLKTRVKDACEDMDKLGIPKHSISYFVCQCAEQMGVSERHLRRLIPSEYKDSNQSGIALKGGHMSASTNIDSTPAREVNGDEIEFQQPPPNPNTGAVVKHPSHLIGRREYDTLKAQFDVSQAEVIKLKKQLDDVVVDIHFLIALAEGNESNEELGEKVRVAVRDDPRYKAYLKKQKLKAKRDGKAKKSKAKQK